MFITSKIEISLRKLVYIVDGEKLNLRFNFADNLKVLKNLIGNSQEIDLADYDIIYNNARITNSENKSINEIVGTDKSPVFVIRKKGTFVVILLEIDNRFKNKVIIENFPSRTEIYSVIDDFMQSNAIPDTDYGVENKTSIIEVSFKLSDFMFKLMRYIKNIKSNNPIYSKLRSNLEIEDKQKNSEDTNQLYNLPKNYAVKIFSNVSFSPLIYLETITFHLV